jgi:DNA-binding NarL/FixJ family response regulator
MKPRILIIDDELEVRSCLEKFLASRGFAVASASSCAEGRLVLDCVPADAIVLDYGLPDGDGIGLIATVKQQTPRAATVLITGSASIELAVRAIRAGADDVIAKPLELSILASSLESLLAGRRMEAGLPTLREIFDVIDDGIVVGDLAFEQIELVNPSARAVLDQWDAESTMRIAPALSATLVELLAGLGPADKRWTHSARVIAPAGRAHYVRVCRLPSHPGYALARFTTPGLCERDLQTALTQRFRLSKRECDVLIILREGASNAQIGQQLGLSVPTVKTYLSRIFDAMGASSRGEVHAMLRTLF